MNKLIRARKETASSDTEDFERDYFSIRALTMRLKKVVGNDKIRFTKITKITDKDKYYFDYELRTENLQLGDFVRLAKARKTMRLPGDWTFNILVKPLSNKGFTITVIIGKSL